MKRIALIIQGMIIICLMIFLSQPCLAGVIIQQVVKDREGIASTVYLYFSQSQFRTDHPEAGLTTIMDFKSDRMVMIDHRSKSYVETKFSWWEKEVGRRLKEESPVIKPKTRKILLKKAEEKAVINGFQTEKIQIFADGELIEENWVTRDVDIKEIEEVMERVAHGFSMDFRSEMKEGLEIHEKLKSYGFPILIKDYSITYGLKPIDVLEVKKIERKELKDEVFFPPDGYQRVIPEPSEK